MSLGISAAVQRLPSNRRAGDGYSVLGISPKLAFDFNSEYYRTNGGQKSFSDAMTFARAGLATMVDSDGLIKWSPHNLLPYSEDFTQWNSVRTTITADQVIAPNGEQTADYVEQQSGQTNGGSVFRSVSVSAGKHVFSVFAKFAEKTHIRMYEVITDGTANQTWFDIQNGTVGTTDPDHTASIANVGNGWYLCSVEMQVSTSVSNLVAVYVADADNSQSVTDSGGIYIWGAHVYRSDLGGMVNNPDRGDSYVPTTSSAVYLPRRGHHKYNGDQWVNKGILAESEARSNLLTYSNDFSSDWTTSSASLTADQLTSPDGQVNASLLVGNGSSLFPTLAYALSISSTTTVTFSFHVKANTADEVFVRFAGTNVNGGTVSVTGFNFATETFDTRTGTAATSSNYEKLANGWYRLSVTVTGDAFTDVSIRPEFNAANTDSVYIYGAQLESASTPSSYIPTNGATVTRAAETVTVPYANLPWPTPTYIGDELVTNGTFDTDVSGWTASTSILSVESSALKITSDGVAGNKSAYQIISGLTVGGVYEISLDVVSETGVVTQEVRVGNGVNQINVLFENQIFFTGQTYTFKFVATATSHYLSILFYDNTGDNTKSSTFDNISVREINPLSVSIAMMGEMNYADTDGLTSISYRWSESGSNYIGAYLYTTGTETGEFNFFHVADGVLDLVVASTNQYTPDINVPMNIAARHGSTFVNGAIDGVALTANTTPTALPDLSTTDLRLAYDFMGTISEFRIWDRDIQDSGLVEATKPSLEPSLSLTFDGQPSSFTNSGLTV